MSRYTLAELLAQMAFVLLDSHEFLPGSQGNRKASPVAVATQAATVKQMGRVKQGVQAAIYKRGFVGRLVMIHWRVDEDHQRCWC